MKKFTDFSKLKVGDWFLSIWKANGKNKRISIVRKTTPNGLIRDVWTLKGGLGDRKTNETNKTWNKEYYNFYKLNKEEIKKYMMELTLRELGDKK